MNKARFLFAILLMALAASVLAQSQDATNALKPPANDLFERWDDLNQRLLYHRTVLKPSLPGIYVADAQGRQILAIDVLKDFPGALHGSVDLGNIAGGPNGSVVLFCVLDYGARPLRELILTYSSSGMLRSTIDADPYEASALTVDDQGNIYIFADNYLFDVDDPRAVYPTIVKYDSGGRVIKTMLPSSNFAAGDYPTDSSEQNGSPLLRVTSKGIVVFAALSGKWFLLSQQGEILAQRDLSRVVRKVADQNKFRRESVIRSFLGPNGELVLYLRLDDGPFDSNSPPPPDQIRLRESVVRVDPSNLEITEVKEHAEQGDSLVGINGDGTPVYEHRLLNVSKR
jgi:hypothetical protein